MKPLIILAANLILGSRAHPHQQASTLNRLVDQGKFDELHILISSTKNECTRWRYRAIAAPYIDLLDSNLLDKHGIQKRCRIHDSIWLPGLAASMMNRNRTYSGYTSPDIVNRNKMAHRLIEKCTTLFPRLEVCQDLRARWHEFMGYPDSALSSIEKALKLNGSNPYFQALRGKYLYSLGNQASGYETLSNPTLCNNQSSYQGRACFEAMQMIGRIHLQAGQPDSSLNYLQIARIYRQWSHSLDFEMGCAWLKKENTDSACHYLKGMTLTPDIHAMDSLQKYCQDQLPP